MMSDEPAAASDGRPEERPESDAIAPAEAQTAASGPEAGPDVLATRGPDPAVLSEAEAGAEDSPGVTVAEGSPNATTAEVAAGVMAAEGAPGATTAGGAPGVGPGPSVGPEAVATEDALRLAEALIFASAAPVTPRALTQLLPDDADADTVIAALRERYAGRGVELVDAAGGVQFRTAPDLASRLRKVVEVKRRLPRVAMETLAIIAYHQPVTRPEIEEIRGTSLSQQTLDSLLEANLVAPKGRRESPGRPTLWGTTSQFLEQFGLKDLRELPRRDDLLLEPPRPAKPSSDPADEASPAEPEPTQGEPDPAGPDAREASGEPE